MPDDTERLPQVSHRAPFETVKIIGDDLSDQITHVVRITSGVSSEDQIISAHHPSHQKPWLKHEAKGCDAVQYRIRLNEAQREIDRMRRGADCVDVTIVRNDPAGARNQCSQPLYAVPKLGEIDIGARVSEPLPPIVRHLDSHLHVTNYGTLLDVLA